MKQVLLYLPVIHAGYEAFLRRHADAAEILLLGSGFTADYPSLAKDIRALPAARAAGYLRLDGGDASIRVVEPAGLAAAVTGDPLVLPDEEVMRDIAARYELGAGRSLVFDRTFLRWDRDWATAKYARQLRRRDHRRRAAPRAAGPGPGPGRAQFGLVAAGGGGGRPGGPGARLLPGTTICRPSTPRT